MRRLEDLLQIGVVELLQRQALPGVRWIHAANAGKRSARMGARLKLMGMTPGWPDLTIIAERGQAYLLELKWGKGKLSPAQMELLDHCNAYAIPYAIAKSVDGAQAILAGWGLLKGYRVAA